MVRFMNTRSDAGSDATRDNQPVETIAHRDPGGSLSDGSEKGEMAQGDIGVVDPLGGGEPRETAFAASLEGERVKFRGVEIQRGAGAVRHVDQLVGDDANEVIVVVRRWKTGLANADPDPAAHRWANAAESHGVGGSAGAAVRPDADLQVEKVRRTPQGIGVDQQGHRVHSLAQAYQFGEYQTSGVMADLPINRQMMSKLPASDRPDKILVDNPCGRIHSDGLSNHSNGKRIAKPLFIERDGLGHLLGGELPGSESGGSFGRLSQDLLPTIGGILAPHNPDTLGQFCGLAVRESATVSLAAVRAETLHGHRRERAALLRDVSQFVGEQMGAGTGLRRIATRIEHDVVAYSVGEGIDAPRAGGSAGVIVDTHLTEIVSKSRFHEGTGRGLERATGRTQNVVDDGRCSGGGLRGPCGLPAFTLQAFLFTFLALAVGPGVSAAGTFALNARVSSWSDRGASVGRAGCAAQNLVCDPVSLLFETVVGCTDRELAL